MTTKGLLLWGLEGKGDNETELIRAKVPLLLLDRFLGAPLVEEKVLKVCLLKIGSMSVVLNPLLTLKTLEAARKQQQSPKLADQNQEEAPQPVKNGEMRLLQLL